MMYAERPFLSADGLELRYRDYGPKNDKPPLICLAGLTRNARDFHDFATHFGKERRVIALDLRGRGRSARDPNWQNYQPPTYMNDVVTLITTAGLNHFVLVGTSLGGLISMGVAATLPKLTKGVVLNDIGPDMDPTGIGRIAAYVGTPVFMPDFTVAGAALKAQFRGAYPDLAEERWPDFARRIFVNVPGKEGLELDYDLDIAKPIQQQVAANAPPPDLWPLFRMLRNIPVLAIRGALSDVLSASTFERMGQDMPKLTRLVVANRGHVPLLDEPEVVNAVEGFLQNV
jgi:pimeloyl-ACP methyl ester carboxylesterase